MQENHLFEYAVIRLVPRVERQEFMNVGVVMYCKSLNFLKVLFDLNKSRLLAFSKNIDIETVQRNLTAFQNICEGNVKGGPIAKFEPADRFRWLTATRSTVIQSSQVHPGFCAEPLHTLERLLAEQVS